MLIEHNYIGGEWRAAGSDKLFELLNPCSEQVEAQIRFSSAADVDDAIAEAKKAFAEWSATEPSERLAILNRIAEVYKAKSAEMAEAICLEMGAPIDLASGPQVGVGLRNISDAIETLRNYRFEQAVNDNGEFIVKEAIGVCALITPWNWPMNQVTLKVLPALAAGCTMILKPSEHAPLSSRLFAEILDEAGVPAGVFNMVFGDGVGAGAHLAAHEDVDMISFTGSGRAGKAISQAAAANFKRVSLELGGKGANIVFADVDDEAISRGVKDCFRNSGQSCNAPTRMLVEASKYDEAVKIAAATARDTRVAMSSEPGDHIGPVISARQYQHVQGLIEAGMRDGARLVAGGAGRPDGMKQGYFVKPTVFADCTPDMAIMRDEIFGPVLCIAPFKDAEEAIRIANETPYGLTNYVQTGDKKRARKVASQLRSGMVEINCAPRSKGTPFGGYKQSGNGREGGVYGLEEFLETKVVSGG